MKRISSYLLVLIIIFSSIPSAFANASATPSVSYRTHVQNVGWQNYVADGEMSGTSQQSLRLEGINIKILGDSNLGAQYSTQIQDIGWQGYVSDNNLSGTTGRSLRLEAIKIKLTGSDASLYDIYYRVHVQNYGWLGWAKNGNAAGTEGLSLRLEAIQIKLVSKEYAVYLDLSTPFISAFGDGSVLYRTHVQNFGWQNYVSDGTMSGTQGQSLRLEGINIRLHTNLPSGDIIYSTHVQDIGWMPEVCNGALSGTQGQSKRLEAIRIRLSGEISQTYDVYYRVHAQNVGWLGWAKNGSSAGTAGFSLRLEGIQILLVAKGAHAPDYAGKSFVENGHMHSFSSEIITPPTCTAAGIRKYTCTICGEEYTETIPSTGHKYDAGVVVTPPTCTTAGIRKYTCTVCGATYTETIPATGHKYDAGVVITPPTCTTAGIKKYTCTVCGETYTETIPATGHNYDSGVVVTPPTCISEGIIKYTCSVCGATYTETIPTVGHQYDAGVVVIPPTCTTAGTRKYTCTVCGETYTETIPATGHTPGEFEIVSAPTLTSTGLKVKRCTVCGEILEQQIIPALSGWLTENGQTYYYSNAQKVTGWQNIGGFKYYFDANGVKASKVGIDVSRYEYNIDWKAVKASGVDFAMIRLGYRGYGTGTLVLDPYFLQNIQGAKNAGVDIGIYFFSQAITTAEADEEANMVLTYIKNYNINVTYPIAFDTEDISGDEGRADSLSATDRTTIAIQFCENIKNGKFVPMVYSNKYFLLNNLEMSRLSSYQLWMAQYTNTATYPGVFKMWQYSDAGTVGGISGNVDLDVWLN